MPKEREFTIGVYRPGPNRLIREAEVDLPASATELVDLFQRARINNECDIYSVELLFCKREFLWVPLENQTLGVYGLNYLAWRLAGLIRNRNTKITIHCRNIKNNTNNIPITKRSRNLCDHVKPDTLMEAPLPGAGLTVRFTSAASQKKTAAQKTANGMPVHEPFVDVDLPISEKELENVKTRLKCSAEDLRVSPEDSLVPSMMPHIRPDEDIGELNAFALCTKALHDMGQLPLYKAILAATACTTICHANTCATEIGQYRLEPEVSTPEEYGRDFLMEKLGAEHISAFDRTALWSLGTKLIREQNIRETDYGLLCRKNGEPIMLIAERDMEPTLENGVGFIMPDSGQTVEQVDDQLDEQTFEQTM